MSFTNRIRTVVRASQIRAEGIRDPRRRAWKDLRSSWARACNICGWHGVAFHGPDHSEMAVCPNCDSVARDRYLFWCWTHRIPYQREHQVLETSPRMNQRYRDHMSELVNYLASDYDESAHKAMIKLDLQKIDRPDQSLDVILTSHVLEHVPDTGKALSELYRVIRPGGSILLLIPMPQGQTAPPETPEFHGDNTVVYWRFGWDLRHQLEAAGFDVTCLVTQPLIDRIRRGDFDSGISGPDVDEISLLKAADPETLTSIANAKESERFGFRPDAHFVAWHCVRPTA
jgi:SAM-dependent methyltransferase